MGKKRKTTDHGRLERAVCKREKLLESAEFSAPLEDRHYGILVASPDIDKEKLKEVGLDSEFEFVDEGEMMREFYREIGHDASMAVVTDRDSAMSFIINRRYTDLVMIGHGVLGRLMLDDNNLSWWHISRGLDHLKTGCFYQRHCGFRWDRLNIALGTFAVSDMTNVYASVGMPFQKEFEDYYEYNDGLDPVYQSSRVHLDDLIEIGRIKDPK